MKRVKLPQLLRTKIYKTGQTRGADDDVIYQNRVGRNSTVLIPLEYYEKCTIALEQEAFESGFIVLIKPELYFDNPDVGAYMASNNLTLGVNSVLLYETREQWQKYNPEQYGYKIPSSRINPLGGEYVARVPSTTSKDDENICRGYSSSGLKGAGIRIYEYANKYTIEQCRYQLEYLYWLCVDSYEVSIQAGMTEDEILLRRSEIFEECKKLNLADEEKLYNARMIDKDLNTVCPLCLEKLSANGFYNRMEQAEGRDVPDLTVTQINLFHIQELRIGQYNHRPYNLGWGHHHCNVVCKDSGIEDTLNWMRGVILRNDVL